MDLTLVAAFAAAALLLSIAPGPDLMFIVANATAGGRLAGIVAAVGVSTGLVVHTLAAAFGLGALVQAAPQILDVVRIAGAVFLVYLAFATLRANRRQPGEPAAEEAPRRLPLRKIYLMAALTNVANPKVVLFYLAFFPQFLTTGPQGWPVTAQLLALGCLFIVIGLAVDGSVGALAGTLSDRFLRRGAFHRWLNRVSAAIFGGLAVRLALDAR